MNMADMALAFHELIILKGNNQVNGKQMTCDTHTDKWRVNGRQSSPVWREKNISGMQENMGYHKNWKMLTAIRDWNTQKAVRVREMEPSWVISNGGNLIEGIFLQPW